MFILTQTRRRSVRRGSCRRRSPLVPVPVVVLDPKSLVVLQVVALVVVGTGSSRVLAVVVGSSIVMIEALMSQLSHICCNWVVLVVVHDQVLS